MPDHNECLVTGQPPSTLTPLSADPNFGRQLSVVSHPNPLWGIRMGKLLLGQFLSQVSVLHLVFLQCRQLCEEEPDGTMQSISALQSVKPKGKGKKVQRIATEAQDASTTSPGPLDLDALAWPTSIPTTLTLSCTSFPVRLDPGTPVQAKSTRTASQTIHRCS